MIKSRVIMANVVDLQKLTYPFILKLDNKLDFVCSENTSNLP